MTNTLEIFEFGNMLIMKSQLRVIFLSEQNRSCRSHLVNHRAVVLGWAGAGPLERGYLFNHRTEQTHLYSKHSFMNESHVSTMYYVVISYPLPRTYFRLESRSREGAEWPPSQDEMRREEKVREKTVLT